MAVHHVQKSFEQSLRSSSPYPALLPPNILKPEIHKGCTGKAHACGTLKMLRNGGVPKGKFINGQGNRKNSLSSETVSDSGSEISSQNSFNGTNAVSLRRRTSDNVSGTKVDTGRNRLYSDGDKEDSDKVDCIPSSFNRLQHSRSFRVTSSRNGGIRPPWQNVYGKQSSPVIPSLLSSPNSQPKLNGVSRSSSFNSRCRSSFRRRNDIVQWTQMWERSFTQRGDGGLYKTLDKIKLNQVIHSNSTYFVAIS